MSSEAPTPEELFAAYSEGWDSCWEHRGDMEEAHNPYDGHSALFREWWNGWEDAH